MKDLLIRLNRCQKQLFTISLMSCHAYTGWCPWYVIIITLNLLYPFDFRHSFHSIVLPPSEFQIKSKKRAYRLKWHPRMHRTHLTSTWWIIIINLSTHEFTVNLIDLMYLFCAWAPSVARDQSYDAMRKRCSTHRWMCKKLLPEWGNDCVEICAPSWWRWY